MIQPETIAGLSAAQKRKREAKNANCRRDGNGSIFVPLTKGYEAVIDEADLEIISQFSWFSCPSSTVNYAKASVPLHLRDRWPTKIVAMHQVIMDVKDGRRIDHKDRNGLNCRRSNLRFATNSQNCANRVWPRSTKTKYRGLAPVGKRWAARIQLNRKMIHIGVFDTEKDAAIAYNEAAKKLHGEFAVLNSI
jgi:hypothetical protein